MEGETSAADSFLVQPSCRQFRFVRVRKEQRRAGGVCEPISQQTAALFLVWAHPEPRETGQTLISVNFLLVRREGGKPKD